MRLNCVIGVKISEEDRLLLDNVCNARGEDLSSFVRRAIRKELASLSFYPDDIKKALGILKRAKKEGLKKIVKDFLVSQFGQSVRNVGMNLRRSC